MSASGVTGLGSPRVTHCCTAATPALPIGSQVQRRWGLGCQGSVQAASREQGVTNTWRDGQEAGTQGGETLRALVLGGPEVVVGGLSVLVPGGRSCVRARCRAPAKPLPALVAPGLWPRPRAASGNEGGGRIRPQRPVGCKPPRPDPTVGSRLSSVPRREILRQCHHPGRAEHPASEAPQLILLAAKPPSAKATPVPPSHPAGGFPLLQPQHHFFQLFFCRPAPGLIRQHSSHGTRSAPRTQLRCSGYRSCGATWVPRGSDSAVQEAAGGRQQPVAFLQLGLRSLPTQPPRPRSW